MDECSLCAFRRVGLWVVAGAALLAAWHAFLASGQSWSTAGDSYCCYFPAARGLLDAHGLNAFAPLHRGQARMPLFSTLVAFFGLMMPTLNSAAQVTNILAWTSTFALTALALSRLGWGRAAPFVLLGLGASAVVSRTAADALPEAVYAAACAATLFAVVVAWSSRRRRDLLLLGLAVAAAFQSRFNGAALLVAVPVAAALFWPGPRRAACGWLAIGIAGGLLPTLVLIIYLESHGISYPNLYFGEVNLPAGSTLSLATLLQLTATGLAESVQRWSSAGIPWPVQLLGLGTLLVAAWRDEPRGTMRAAALVIAALVGILIPLHHEARFQVPFLPIWFAAAGVGALYLLEHVAGSARRFAAPVAVAVGALLLLPGGMRASLVDRELRIGVARGLTEGCATVLGLSPERPVQIGVAPDKYSYHWLRGCSLLPGLPVRAIPLEPDAQGVDLRLAEEAVPESEAMLSEPDGRRLSVVRSSSGLTVEELVEPPSALDPSVHLMELPHSRAHRCEHLSLATTTGAGLWIDLWTPSDNGLDLTLDGAGDTQRRFTLSSGGKALRIELVPALSGGEVDVTYCPADPILAGDPVRFRLTVAQPRSG